MRAHGSLPPGFDAGPVTTVHQGDCCVSSDPNAIFSTVLGSCVAACVRDVARGIGGMNHFLLAEPKDAAPDRFGASARYGAFAMELLINRVLSRGSGLKANLEIKVFGGGLSHAVQDVGARNVSFVREFLAIEGYVATSEDLGGDFARRLLYRPVSGRAVVKRLEDSAAVTIVDAELMLARRRAAAARPYEDIELF